MKKCPKKNVPLYQGNKYPCHKAKSGPSEHNFFCYQCATGKDQKDRTLKCFKHRQQAGRDPGDPFPVMDA